MAAVINNTWSNYVTSPPPAWLSTWATQNQQLACGAANGAWNDANSPPYSVPIGVVDTKYGTVWGPACDVLTGAAGMPDCPTAAGAPGACQWAEWDNPSAEAVVHVTALDTPVLVWGTYTGSGEDEVCEQVGCICDDGILTPRFCAKLAYDATAFQTPCCMGTPPTQTVDYSSAAVGVSRAPTAVGMPLASAACDPRWCPADPVGQCEPVYAAVCNSATTDASGTWMHAMLVPDSPCATWYQAALTLDPASAPPTRYPIIDGMIEAYCASPDPRDTVSCACYLFGSADNRGLCQPGTTSGCTPYTSYTTASTNPPDSGLRSVAYMDAVTSVTVGISDYACVAPQCHGGKALIPGDVAAMQADCPTLCATVNVDHEVAISGGTVTGGIYVDLDNQQCSGSAGTSTAATPVFALTNDLQYTYPQYNVTGACPPQSTACSVSGYMYFALADGSAPLVYTVTMDPLPPGIALQDGTALQGTLSAQQLLTLEFQFDGSAVPTGVYAANVYVSDTRPQFADGVKTEAQVSMAVMPTETPPPPQAPPGPNPGVGPADIYINATPSWVQPLLVGLAVAVALALLLQFVLSRRHASISALLTQAAALSVAVPAAPSK